jgi:hypothetical protein
VKERGSRPDDSHGGGRGRGWEASRDHHPTDPDTTHIPPTTAAPSLGNSTQHNGMERNGTERDGSFFLELAGRLCRPNTVCSLTFIFLGFPV